MMRFLVFLLLGVTAPVMAQAPRPELPKLEVSVNRVDQDGQHMYEVDATGTVAAPLPKVWRILTGYDRMAEFVPDMESSKVLSRNGGEVIIEQFGVARFLFMSRTIHLIVRAVEQPMSSIDISLISGDMKHYESRWELVPVPETGGTKIIYHGKMLPNFYVPSLLGAKMVRGDIERMMNAVLARLDRRDAPRVEAIPQQ
ncbi:ribosome-associated toxin RatA of RatAB toxin-antitoxin module [Duganella sp. 1224]|uniref:SRPBCC family protein n=1 Tax=Duganella sp. 1224 TaxID=2587052 RepID=UPI0017AB4A39|nr:SRPBCC family protein [Duganella sp. 1224]NYE62916.1 ribosome-associated toxin RatA of RatAB toxin-antitoxin module [Duganella sp. 1224]